MPLQHQDAHRSRELDQGRLAIAGEGLDDHHLDPRRHDVPDPPAYGPGHGDQERLPVPEAIGGLVGCERLGIAKDVDEGGMREHEEPPVHH